MTRFDNDRLLIAETDEAGRVLWLWAKTPHDRTARPLKPEDVKDLHLEAFRISGASRAEAQTWLGRFDPAP